MEHEVNNKSENAIVDRSWNVSFYIISTITLCFLISMVTFYLHASNIEGGLGYPYDRTNKFPGLQFHEVIAELLLLTWFLAFLTMFILAPFALFRKRKVSWKALFFCIASQVTLFL